MKKKSHNHIQFTGVSMNPEYNPCQVSKCKNGAVTALWYYPDGRKRTQFDICGWHLKVLYESVHGKKR